MGSGFSKKRKQAKAMQEQFMKMQEQLKELEATGEAGGGLVSVTLNGEHELKKIRIKPDCVDPEDVEGLEDLILAAHKDALEKLQKNSSSGLGGMMPSGLPGM